MRNSRSAAGKSWEVQPSDPTPLANEGTETIRLDLRSDDPRLLADRQFKAALPVRPRSRPVTVADRFTLLKQVGSGGFGEVWRAYDAASNSLKAVKIITRVLDHDDGNAEQRTLAAIQVIDHPHLLRTECFFVEGNQLILVMELANGSLRETGTLSQDHLLTYMKQTATALDHLHQQRIFHRDIKPENLLLVGPLVKVADFGLAKLAENSRSIRAGFAGSPAYSSPETWRGRITSRSDQYSLALTYAELRLGYRVFKSTSIYDCMIAHTEASPDLAALPAGEQAVVRQALSKTPEHRFETCVAFMCALEIACQVSV